MISSGSRKFLEDIKDKFNIRHEIFEDHRTEYIDPITNEIIKKDTLLYRMTLGSNLFNQMLDNYKYSMFRKRVYFTKPRLYKEDYTTKEELENLVWEMPLYEIAEKFGISVEYVKKWCTEWKIERPDPQYFPQLARKKFKK